MTTDRRRVWEIGNDPRGIWPWPCARRTPSCMGFVRVYYTFRGSPTL
jgi:hypothetical protein